MPTIKVSLPDAMAQWIEGQVESGRYPDAGAYVRELIRRDREATGKIARLQALVTEGVESGRGHRTMDELRQEALRRFTHR